MHEEAECSDNLGVRIIEVTLAAPCWVAYSVAYDFHSDSFLLGFL